MEYPNKHFPWVAGLAGVMLVGLSLWVAVRGYPPINEQLFLAINRLGSRGGWFWQNVTILGEGLVAFVLLASCSRRDGHFIRTLLLAALIAGLASQLLKQFLDMPRPAALLDPDTFNLIGAELRAHAFPSGHATTALVAAVMGAWRFPRLAPAVYGLFALVAFSRMVVGAHWPFDVLAGACLGYLCAVLARYIASAWPRTEPGWLAPVSWLIVLALALWLPVFPLDYPAARPLVLGVAGAGVVTAILNIRKLLSL